MAGTYTCSVTHVRNSEIKQLRPLFSAILWDIDLIFGMCVYNDKLQIKFTFRSGPMIFGRVIFWNLAKYLVVATFFRYAWILTWFLVYECIMMSLHFVPVQWFFGQMSMIWDIDLIFGMRVYNHKFQINFEIHLLFLAYYWGN